MFTKIDRFFQYRLFNKQGAHLKSKCVVLKVPDLFPFTLNSKTNDGE